MNVRFASRVAEKLKTQDLRKLGNFKRISEKLGIGGKSLAGQTKAKYQQMRLKIVRNIMQSIPKKRLFYLILWIFLQYFAQLAC